MQVCWRGKCAIHEDVRLPFLQADIQGWAANYSQLGLKTFINILFIGYNVYNWPIILTITKNFIHFHDTAAGLILDHPIPTLLEKNICLSCILWFQVPRSFWCFKIENWIHELSSKSGEYIFCHSDSIDDSWVTGKNIYMKIKYAILNLIIIGEQIFRFCPSSCL